MAALLEKEAGEDRCSPTVLRHFVHMTTEAVQTGPQLLACFQISSHLYLLSTYCVPGNGSTKHETQFCPQGSPCVGRKPEPHTGPHLLG